MGNEMGNNNTSGLREEDSTNNQAQEKSLQEPVHNWNVKGENYVVPTTGNRDYNQNETGLASDDPKEAGEPPVHNQTTDGPGQGTTEVNPPAESAESEKKSNEESGNGRDIQPVVSLPMEEDNKNAASGENVLEISNKQIENQPSFKKEAEDIPSSISFAISSAHDPESEDSAEPNSDQHEYAKLHADQQDRIDSPRGTADVLGSSTAYSSKENDHQLDTYTSDSLEGTILSDTNVDVERRRDELLVKDIVSQENGKPGKDEFEVEVGTEVENIFSKTIMVTSNLLRDDGEFVSKMNCNGPLNDHIDGPLPEDKCIVLTHETKLIGKELESEENNHDHPFSAVESSVDKANSSQTDSLTRLNCNNIEVGGCGSLTTAHDAASNGHCEAKEVKVVEESNDQSEASEENCSASEGKIAHELGIFAAQSSIANGKNNEEEPGDCIPEAYTIPDAANNGNCQIEGAKAFVESDKQNECSEEHCNGSEGKHVTVCELGIIEAKLSIGNVKNNEEESEDLSPEAFTAHDAAFNGNSQVEEVKVPEDSHNKKQASGEICEGFERKTVMIHELEMISANSPRVDGEVNEEESKDHEADEAYEEMTVIFPELATVAAELSVTGNEKEAEDCKDEENGTADKQILEMEEKTEAPCAPAEQHVSWTPASLLQSEHLQQETVKKSEDAQDSNDSTLEPKPESSNGSSKFQDTNSPVDSVASAVEKPVEEVLPYVTGVPEMVTGTVSSTSANHSGEQREKNETCVFASDGFEAQEKAGWVNAEPIHENLIQADRAKSPSSTVESTISVVQLGVENPQEYLPSSRTVPEAVTQAKPSASASQSSEQYGKVESSVLATGGYEPQESGGRFSIESIPDNMSIHAEMQKSPSFNLDLRIEARSGESDQTPLLYQDKNAIEDSTALSSQADVRLQNSLPQAQHGQESSKYEEMPMEEKVITLERSDSEKSRTPFLGYLREDEEAQLVVVSKRKEDCVEEKKTSKDSWNSSSTKEISATPPKNKQKHKRRSSLFTNCMCCTTVIN